MLPIDAKWCQLMQVMSIDVIGESYTSVAKLCEWCEWCQVMQVLAIDAKLYNWCEVKYNVWSQQLFKL